MKVNVSQGPTYLNEKHLPLIGAEIMDNPAATPELVDHWFKVLADHHMPLARVFIPSEKALCRMDWFFAAAEKYGVGISATLGGWPSEETGNWIRAVVERYKDSPALDSWILMNEPGQAPEPSQQALEKFRIWLSNQYNSIDALNLAWQKQYQGFENVDYESQWVEGKLFTCPVPFLDWYTFWRSHLTWRLNWIADQIRRADSNHPTHVNPHALIGNLAANSIDLPAWRGFLDSYGASCHPSWHFNLLGRDQFALGVAYVCDLIRGAAGGKPFWITELQGGNNTNSGSRPFYPYPQDIAQWLWTGFGSGAERIIFWLLNNRTFGGESGEWSLLDFQNQPSERLEVACKIASILNENLDFFQNAQPVEAPITILLSLETMTLQERFERTQPVNSVEKGIATRLEGRGRNAHLLAVLAYYEIFQQMGIPVQIQHIHDFDWTGKSRLLILPDIVALSQEQAQNIEAFVKNGNTAFITGLTGAWDPENRFWALTSRFPLENLLGATLKEIRTVEPGACVHLTDPQMAVPAHLWISEIRNFTAEPIGSQDGQITAVRNRAGQGEVIWIPALVDIAAWQGDNRALAAFLSTIIAPFTRDLPFHFVDQQPCCVLRVLQNGSSYITVITNGTQQAQSLQLQFPVELHPKILWSDGSTLNEAGEVRLVSRGTVVALWR